jgi:hypothetical protein
MSDVVEPRAVSLRRSSPVRRVGCAFLLILWFALLLVPCGLFIMATQGQLTIAQGDLPGQEIRLWLIMEADQRGFGLSSTSATRSGNAACLQTDTRFLLWAGREDPLSYCECYEKADTESVWTPTSTESGVCD